MLLAFAWGKPLMSETVGVPFDQHRGWDKWVMVMDQVNYALWAWGFLVRRIGLNQMLLPA